LSVQIRNTSKIGDHPKNEKVKETKLFKKRKIITDLQGAYFVIDNAALLQRQARWSLVVFIS